MNWNNDMIMLVSILIYCFFLAGAAMLMLQDLETAWQRFRLRKRLLARQKSFEKSGGLRGHLEELVLGDARNATALFRFLLLSMVLFLMVLVTGIRSLTPLEAFISAAATGLMPYLLLRTRHEVRKRKGSHEGEAFVSNFISQYRLSSFNIFDGIEQMIRHHPETPIMNRLLTRLLMELRTTADPIRIRRACDRFSNAAGTNWAGMLAYSIGQAAESGINISSAVEDVLIQMREARQLMEERRRLNGEAVRIVIYLIPVLFIGGALLSVKGMGLGWKDYFHNQFLTSQGFLLFLASLFLMMINTLLLEAVNNRQFDF